jgi:hypothetical protein
MDQEGLGTSASKAFYNVNTVEEWKAVQATVEEENGPVV